jgi:hypothetical protein
MASLMPGVEPRMTFENQVIDAIAELKIEIHGFRADVNSRFCALESSFRNLQQEVRAINIGTAARFVFSLVSTLSVKLNAF